MTRNDASTAIDPYTSSAALRRAHLDLKQNALSSTAQDMRDFIARAGASGAFIHDENERRMAQAIIDYWTTELAGSPGADSAGNLPALLAPFDAGLAVHTPEQPFAAEPERDKRARDMIRISATARLWQDTKDGAGFLLVGDAINQAARFRDLDPDIDQLVNASRKAVTRKRRNYALLVVLTLGLIGFLLGHWVPSKINSHFVVLSGQDPKASQNSLEWIARYQKFASIRTMSKFHLTEVILPKEADLNGIELYGANFSRAKFDGVNFTDAMLPSSSFMETKINGTKFANAQLHLSRFKAATIVSTSFAGAVLYRAEFDEAKLNDVDFSGADLRLASFRDVEIDAKSKEHFKRTAWWLARGWSSDNLRTLLRAKPDLTAIKDSAAFKDEIQKAEKLLDGTEAGSLERALALNYYAWTCAIWGIELDGAANDKCDKNKQERQAPTYEPISALDAALEAVSIVGKWKKESKPADADRIKSIYANYQDTLGYIYLQLDNPSEALKNLTESTQVLKDSGGVKFRYSVAQYASGYEKDAMENLKISMGKDYNYVPSSELQHLKKYIASSKFLDCVYEFTDNRGSRTQARCTPT